MLKNEINDLRQHIMKKLFVKESQIRLHFFNGNCFQRLVFSLAQNREIENRKY